MKRLAGGAAVTAAVLLAATGASASPGVVITSPTAGAEVSRSATPSLHVTGAADLAVPEPSSQTWYLRRSECASGSDDARLSTVRGGASEQSACGYLAQPLNEVLIATGDEGLAYLYPTEDGVPFTLDASRPITGAVKVRSFAGPATTELQLSGTTAGRQSVVLGSWSQEYIGAANVQTLAFSIQPDASLDKVDLTSMTLWMRTRGVNVLTGSVDHRNGVSYVDVPTWSASFTPRIEVAVDSPSFTKVVKATPAEDGTWTATVPTPAVGSRTLYARLVQGAVRADAEPVPFTVVP